MRGEMASTTVAGKLGLPKEPTYGRYNEAWTEAIKNDPGELRNAARDADKMADYVLQYDPEKPREAAQAPREIAARQEPEKQPERTPEVTMSR